MEFYTAIAKMVKEHQPSGCKILVEINEHYGQEVLQVFKEHGLQRLTLIQDLQGKDRVVVAIK
jgi:release factor glutamine methyltransferase